MLTSRVSISQSDFALAHALSEVPDATAQVDRLAAHREQCIMPCFWIAGCDFAQFDAALAEDESVERVVCEREYEGEKFYHVEWTDEVKQHFKQGFSMEGALLRAEMGGTRWQLTMRFPTRGQFETFREYLAAQGIEFQLESLDEAAAPHQCTGGITPAQEEALTVAVDAGYFAVPRDATMAEVAEELGVSTQAASERIRRGIARFVETVFMTAGVEPEPLP